MKSPDNARFPLISIGIPTYNGRRRLEKALHSIWEQEYPNLEVIISDNCSSDDTQQYIEMVGRNHPMVQYYRQEVNIGLVANFDFTLRKASGLYFMWLADDDTISPGALLKYCIFLNENPTHSLVSGEINYVKDGRIEYTEGGFTIESNWPAWRTLRYYSRAIYGGMFHGLMRRDMATTIPPRFVFGNDIHFVASLAFLGKIRNEAFPGYNKTSGGFSKDIRQCALALGESKLASRFIRVKIATDAFREVMASTVYSRLPALKKIPLAFIAFCSAFAGYYGRVYPFMIGGKIKRFFTHEGKRERRFTDRIERRAAH